jgi:hypothetical protein
MDAQRSRGQIPLIDFDEEGLERKISYRNNVVRPWIIILLLAGAVFAVPFGIVNAVRVYSQYGGSVVVAILYSVFMGLIVGGFMLLDAAYSFGYIGLPTYDELPVELYEALKRYKPSSYLSPYVYYDDRVPRNSIGIWKMRVFVPVAYILSLFVYWGTVHGHDDGPTTPDGIRFVYGNVLLVFLAMLQVKVTVNNVYCVKNEWDFVPDVLAKDCSRTRTK